MRWTALIAQRLIPRTYQRSSGCMPPPLHHTPHPTPPTPHPIPALLQRQPPLPARSALGCAAMHAARSAPCLTQPEP